MTEIPRKPNRILSIPERAAELADAWGLPPEHEDVAREKEPIGADWSRRGREPTLLENYFKLHPERARIFRKSETLQVIQEIQEMLEQARKQEAEIRADLDELRAERGTKKSGARIIEKASLDCHVWGCPLRNRERHQHLNTKSGGR